MFWWGVLTGVVGMLGRGLIGYALLILWIVRQGPWK